jgi:hypothetical protein
MKVPLVSSRFDLSTPEGQQQMLFWFAEADKEAEKMLREIAKTQERAFQGLKDGTSPCATMVIC